VDTNRQTDMDPTVTVFVCALCGEHHRAVTRDPPTDATPEELATLKATWDRAFERAQAADADPSFPKDGRDKRWAAVDRASTDYLQRSRDTGVWQLPDSITTERVEGAWRFRCVECPP
jgi:hypothetical protein